MSPHPHHEICDARAQLRSLACDLADLAASFSHTGNGGIARSLLEIAMSIKASEREIDAAVARWIADEHQAATAGVASMLAMLLPAPKIEAGKP